MEYTIKHILLVFCMYPTFAFSKREKNNEQDSSEQKEEKRHRLSKHLPVHIRHKKHQKKEWNMFKVNKKKHYNN